MAFVCVEQKIGSEAVWKRIGFLGCVIAAAAVALVSMSSPAEARRKKNRGGYAPPYAAMVVDAKSGKTLHAVNEDALRHPASITKVMTLYLMFEQIERGRFTMASPLRVSAHAASQSPSKLYLEDGETIEAEDAIKALITKSANDVAVVIAENISGSEDAFAALMTRKARALGMSRTTFRNASGLPDSEQVTTARDLTILARALQERFPRYYPMFSTRSFQYAGATYRNHNKLLGRIEGVDGIKTGYTRMSGFNLMTSAKADGRQVVAIVLGGRSGRIRDNIMGNLVVAHLPRATSGPRTSTMIAEAPAANERPRPAVVAEAPRAAEPAAATTTPSSTQARVATRSAPLNVAALQPVAAGTTTPSRWSTPAVQAQEIRPRGEVPQVQGRPQPLTVEILPPQRPSRPTIADGMLRPPANVNTTSSIAKIDARDEAKPRVQAAELAKEPVKDTVAIAAKSPSSAWVIQLGATDDEAKAQTILTSAKSKSPATLSDASAFTEKVQKGSATLFRARFAGFDDSKDAEDACRSLKRSGFSCFATRG